MTTASDFLKDFPTTESIELFIKGCDRQDESAREASRYRMENYFNCVDDYSWGGPCDRAQDEARRFRDNAKDKLKRQMENAAPFVKEFSVEVLADLNGNIVSEKLVNTRYGSAWLIGGGENVAFVSTSKRMATYNKKGYKLMQRVYTVEYYYTTKFIDFNGLISVGRVLSESLRDLTEVPQYGAHTRLASEAYFALQNKN